MYTSGIKKWAHILLTALMAFYLTFVFLSKSLVRTFYDNTTAQTPQPVLLYLLCAVLFFAVSCLFLHKLASFKTALFRHSKSKGKLSIGFFASVAVVVLVYYLVFLAAHYPGGFSPDTDMQWQQAHSMEFDDHHPFFHTFLFVVFTRIWDSYTFLILVQIVSFACALAYLAATMRSWGFRFSVILPLCAVMALAKPTRSIVMYFWKDTAMSIFLLFFLSHILNIALSNGEWLKKTSHCIASAALLACITLVRHNAILLTAPMLVLMIVYLSGARRACIRLTAVVLLLVIGFKGPVYRLFQVDSTNDSYLETTGLPMTILLSSYVDSPDTMPADAYKFWEQLEPHDSAVEKYEFGNYNSVKWSWGSDYAQLQARLEQTPPAELLRMTMDTIKGNTTLAIRSLLELTEVVWEPVEKQYHYMDQPNGIPPVYEPIPDSLIQRCASILQVLDGAVNGHIFQKVSAQLGILILVMLLALYVSIHQFRGWGALWLVLPIMCYNFGTMLLLCGPDYRFFHFNCLAAYPLAVLLLSKPRES